MAERLTDRWYAQSWATRSPGAGHRTRDGSADVTTHAALAFSLLLLDQGALKVQQ
jgi:hypothetical protein